MAKTDTWFSRRDAAVLVGVSTDVLDKRLRPELPQDAERRIGRLVELHLPSLVAVMVAAAESEARPKTEDELLLSGEGGDSPSLERLRRAKAELAEIDLAERKKEVVTRSTVVEALTQAHGGLRALIERWERRHRESEAQELRDAIHRGMKALTRAVGEDAGLS